jgi:hypothetical protein
MEDLAPLKRNNRESQGPYQAARAREFLLVWSSGCRREFSGFLLAVGFFRKSYDFTARFVALQCTWRIIRRVGTHPGPRNIGQS